MSASAYRLVLHRDVLSDIDDAPKPIRGRVREAIEGLAQDPLPRAAERLRGRKNAYRIRIGEYRLLYEVHATEIAVYVFGVAHRREAYLRLLRRR